MKRSAFVLLTLILGSLPAFASSARSTQSPTQWSRAKSGYPRAVTSGQRISPSGLPNSGNASITAPVPPPSPTSPTTFKNGVVVPISGSASGTGFQNFLVEWAPGADATSGWQTTGVTLVGDGSTAVNNGSLATWDTSSITISGYYTIRLTVNISGSPEQAETEIYLEHDLLSANWPQFLDQGPANGAGVVPAINSDGSFRLLLEGAAGPALINGKFWSLPLNGPAQSTIHTGHGSFMQPSVAAFNGGTSDQAMVIDFLTGSPVVSDLEFSAQNGALSTLSSSPDDWNVGSQLVVEDLAGNSQWQTVGYGIDYDNSVAHVTAWQPDGSELNSNFPLTVPFQNSNDGRLNRNPVLVGDVDGDGKKEIVVIKEPSATTFSLALFANDGTAKSWQVGEFPGTPVVMAAADLDNNGKLETIVAANTSIQTFLHVFQPDGTERAGWPQTLFNSNMASQSYLAVGDLNVDGNKEIVYSHESLLYVFKPDGSNFSNAWPLQTLPANQSFGYNAITIGDVDGDGFPEIVTVLSTLVGNYADQKLLAIRRDGTISKTWQLNAGNGCWLDFWPAPAIGDFNRDGITDIAVVSIVGAGNCPTDSAATVTVLSTGGRFNPGLNDWPLIRRDPRNTSVLLCSDFCLSASPAQPVAAGSTATYTLTITPNEMPYMNAIQGFTCSGLPKGASCSFNSSSVIPGLANASTTLSISTTSRILAMVRPAGGDIRIFSAACFGVAGLVMIPMLAVPSRLRRKTGSAVLMLLLIGAFAGIGCGGGSGTTGTNPNPNGTPAGSYTVTVSATGASNLARTVKLNLVVQ